MSNSNGEKSYRILEIRIHTPARISKLITGVTPKNKPIQAAPTIKLVNNTITSGNPIASSAACFHGIGDTKQWVAQSSRNEITIKIG